MFDQAVDAWDNPALFLCPLIGREANASPKEPYALLFPATCLLNGEFNENAGLLLVFPLNEGPCG